MVREKRMVDKFLVKSGMLRFSFLMECCHPGSLPDPQLVAAMLDLVRVYSGAIYSNTLLQPHSTTFQYSINILSDYN